MNFMNCEANIIMREMKQIFEYNDILVLSLTIKYPVVSIPYRHFAEIKINNEIYKQINDYYQHVCSTLYDQAVNTYMDSLKNDFPFHSYESFVEYNITYNENCFLSLYKDIYEYTGGAHGITIRSSNTWELCYGENILLSFLFKPNMDIKTFFTEESISQAEEYLRHNDNIYFENYKDLIKENFKMESFYLKPQGIIIYYQQYDIAPYSTGIVEFTIPYCTIGWYPSC